MKLTKEYRKKRIHNRIRKKVKGTEDRPRLSVYRSNKAIYCQVINDVTGNTLAAAASTEDAIAKNCPKKDQAKEVGKLIADRVKSKGIEMVVFDRGGYLYHGRVKSLADGARENGLNF